MRPLLSTQFPSKATKTTLALSIHEKFPDQTRHAVRLLEMRHMPGAVQHRDTRMRHAPCELVGISRRDDAVGFAPDDQGRRGDTVDVFFQTFVGKWPDEFAGAGLRPDEADL